MTRAFDVIVVGARCAGSPTAMLLARKGYRVLLIDRATFPSDTVSSHLVHPLGAAALSRWGLLDRLTPTGCPPIHTYAFDFGPFTISGSPGADKAAVAFCPRRTILDKLLLDAAAKAGAELRGAFTVEEVLSRTNRSTTTERDAPISTASSAIVQGCLGLRCISARAPPTMGSLAPASQPICSGGTWSV
jgi:2-polyprenyl-6-methoxyphenol hydroxylase-like FAD-dependent oxidoreductase